MKNKYYYLFIKKIILITYLELYSSQCKCLYDILEDVDRRWFACMNVGIIEHSCADAEFSLLQCEYVVIDTSLTSAPESIVISELIE